MNSDMDKGQAVFLKTCSKRLPVQNFQCGDIHFFSDSVVDSYGHVLADADGAILDQREDTYDLSVSGVKGVNPYYAETDSGSLSSYKEGTINYINLDLGAWLLLGTLESEKKVDTWCLLGFRLVSRLDNNISLPLYTLTDKDMTKDRQYTISISRTINVVSSIDNYPRHFSSQIHSEFYVERMYVCPDSELQADPNNVIKPQSISLKIKYIRL